MWPIFGGFISMYNLKGVISNKTTEDINYVGGDVVCLALVITSA